MVGSNFTGDRVSLLLRSADDLNFFSAGEMANMHRTMKKPRHKNQGGDIRSFSVGDNWAVSRPVFKMFQPGAEVIEQ